MPYRHTPTKQSHYQFFKSLVFDTDILTTGIRINLAAILLVTMLLLSNYWKKKDERTTIPNVKSEVQANTQATNNK